MVLGDHANGWRAVIANEIILYRKRNHRNNSPGSKYLVLIQTNIDNICDFHLLVMLERPFEVHFSGLDKARRWPIK